MTDLPDAVGSRRPSAGWDTLLLDIRAVAELLNCSERHVHRLRDARAMPPPVRLGRHLIRWPRKVIDDWIASGCKPCEEGDRQPSRTLS